MTPNITACVGLGAFIGVIVHVFRTPIIRSPCAALYDLLTLRIFWDADNVNSERRFRLDQSIAENERLIAAYPELGLCYLDREAYREMPRGARRLRRKFPGGVDLQTYRKFLR